MPSPSRQKNSANRTILIAALTVSTILCATAKAQGADAADEKTANKLTFGGYHFSETGNATDINLRHTNDFGNTWLGFYESSKRDEHQGRAGWDNTFEFSPVRFTPSAQIASHGYYNWSVSLETGNTWFVGAGIGRTNLKPNWNLNFDPNDSWTVSAGLRNDNESIGLQWVRDNRENPDQRHLHAVYRKSLPNGQRLTLDILHKRGLVNGDSVGKTGASVTYDWKRFFIRLAFDPKVNFTNEDMSRVAVGTRF